MGSLRAGAAGESLELRVPDGTVVQTADGEVLADLIGVGTRFVVARGGRGGLGNHALASKRRKAPGFALLGEPGETRDVVLELKSVADVGLVGFPSAGKSSLIAALSAARPKIADYPFTTLLPNLGVVQAGGTTYTVADVPGLIPGAAQGKGLGLEFLRHIERCAVLLHVVDCATEEPGRDPVADIEAHRARAGPVRHGAGRPAAAGRAEQDRRAGRAGRWPRSSGPTWTSAAGRSSRSARPPARACPSCRTRWPPRSSATAPACRRRSRPGSCCARPAWTTAGSPSSATRTTDAFVVRGERPERWVRQTDFGNDEAVGYLADRLARLGVEDELVKAGAVAGAGVTIGEVTFDWEPTLGQRGRGRRRPARHRRAGGDAAPGPPRPSGWSRTGPGTRASTRTRPSRWRRTTCPPEALARHRRPGRGGPRRR